MEGKQPPGDADVRSRLAEGPAAREQVFLSLLPTIDRIAAFVCRRNGLSGAEAEDFRSLVRLKLIENDYDALRRFRGLSTLRTYLAVVIQRRFLDYRISEWGKWRPSAEARRLGPAAIELDRLTGRDGLSAEEAIETILTRKGDAPPREELARLASRLPVRAGRRFVGDENAESLPSGQDLEGEVLGRELAALGSTAASALRKAVDDLPARDRLILKMRFEDSFTVAEIAATLHLEPKPLYRRLEAILGSLKRRLSEAGLTRDEVASVLAHGAGSFDSAPGTFQTGPSLESGSGRS